MTRTKHILSALALVLGGLASPAQATVTAILSAGAGCNGGHSASFTPGGPAVKVSLCVSSTSEHLCGTSYRFLPANENENGRFHITARALGTAYSFSNAVTINYPVPITTPATGDLGSLTESNLPLAPAANQLVATLDIAPQASATSDAYEIRLDPLFSSAVADGGDISCGGVLPTITAPLAAGFAFVRIGAGSAVPIFTSASTTTFAFGSSGSFVVNAIGSPPPSLSLSGRLPAGVAFNAATGLLSGTPTESGTFPLTIMASNGASATQQFMLVVPPPLPVITSDYSAVFTVGVFGSFQVTASGPAPTTVFHVGNLPEGVSFNEATGLLSGTPTSPGSYIIYFRAINANGTSATQPFYLVVAAPLPVITSASGAVFTVGTPGRFQVTASGPVPTRVAYWGQMPEGMRFDDATALLSGTPAGSGTYVLYFQAINANGASATQIFTLTVLPMSPMVNQTISFAGPINQAISSTPINLLATASSGLPVVFSSSTASVCTVSGTTLTMIAAGTCTIAANQSGNASINPAPPVTHSFTIMAPGETNIATLTASVNPLLPALAGRSLTLTALVRMHSPAGTVTFTENGVALTGCVERALSLLANTTDAAVATCTIATPAAPSSGMRQIVATYVYPPNDASGRTAEQIAIKIPFLSAAPTAVPLIPDYTGMWWAGPAENGWGMSITQHGLVQFNVIFTYDDAGRSRWFVMSDGTWNKSQTEFTGALYQPVSSPFSAYNRAQFAPGAAVGSATITYLSGSTATLTYTINGINGTKSIQRQVFAADSGQPRAVVNDLWWAGDEENGWGMNIAQQDRVLFPVWYTYDATGHTTFFAVSAGTLNGTSFSGDIYATESSAWLGVVYNPAQFVATRVGTMTLNFIDQDRATMSYTLNGITQTKSITRQPF